MSQQALATKHPIFSGSNSGAGGGGGATHYHPFKFADASTTGPTVVKTKVAVISNLISVLSPLATMTMTGAGGAGSYADAITLTGACNIWLKGTVASGVCTAAEVTKTDPAGGELLIFSATSPYAQTAFYTLLAQVNAGAAPTEPGYDLMIGGDPFHLRQVAFNHLRLEQRVASGKSVVLAFPV